MSTRKVIFKARVGSHLHGTSTPNSDEDFLGVFIPSADDLLSLQNRPSEWTENVKLSDTARNSKGDVDCKYLAVYEFFKQAAQGQSQALELFFVPDEHVIIKTPEWDLIKAHKHLFVSQKGIMPIIGFAIAQTHKAKVKGDNLNKINVLIEALEAAEAKGEGRTPLWSHFNEDTVFGVPVERYKNDHGYELVTIAGRDYDIGIDVKRFRESMQILEKKYGSRSRMAAAATYDFKSATHAFRLLSEAEEFIMTGNITFPRPDAEFLQQVKSKQYFGDLEVDINERLTNLRLNIAPNSPLQDEPDYSKINKLCREMLTKHIYGQ